LHKPFAGLTAQDGENEIYLNRIVYPMALRVSNSNLVPARCEELNKLNIYLHVYIMALSSGFL